ncbi:RecQ family ATP-dependent DNA helicase [Blastococcus haudaquaticus]|uniref:ATP-dependent DNA helicase RecQ n=1 Tax=Blastococcus haudaquaticus TaxID=1938745 RepID=A0A286GI51_9ACTN|nr:ATP-dependent DNA helicase RecQ [Blastococcus haudaquaticus]SOD95180.1 ATP-dependent DNA helicase RecQ [Blastococcus haudaquaticus]
MHSGRLVISVAGETEPVPPASPPDSPGDNPAGNSASVRTRRIREFARDVLGYSEFRPGQEKAMQAVVGGRDTLAVLPSGAGKTAVYQVAGQLLDGPVVVVSPLIALQRDQVERLAEIEDRAGRAAQLNSTMSAGDQREALDSLRDGTVRFLFLAPEQLAKPEVVDAVAEAKPALFVVDEAHCVSAWGHDFRPDYLRLGGVVEQLGHPTVLALTATAAPPVRAEIVERLEMREPEIVVAGFDRPEIRLEVDHHADARGKELGVLERVLAEVSAGRGPGIVYSATRRGTEDIATQLADRGLRVRPYHAGLGRSDREDAQRAWMDDELDVVVATTAFGMGIDKPGTRFVVHAEPADSIDSYYQEIGRAGRDGEPALAVLVYRQEDLGIRRFFAAGTPGEEELQQVAGLVQAAAAAGIDEGVDVKDLREETGRAATPLARDLNLLEQVEAVVLDEEGAAHPAKDGPGPAEAAAAARELAEHHEKVDQSRVEMMRGYAETTECRRQFLLGYFGEQLDEPCGNCDTCSAGTAQHVPGPDDHDTPFPVEMPVEHSEWGAGVVMRVEDDRVTVLFDDVGYKTLGVAAVLEHDLLRARG